jgi:hypothetical protein
VEIAENTSRDSGLVETDVVLSDALERLGDLLE